MLWNLEKYSQACNNNLVFLLSSPIRSYFSQFKIFIAFLLAFFHHWSLYSSLFKYSLFINFVFSFNTLSFFLSHSTHSFSILFGNDSLFLYYSDSFINSFRTLLLFIISLLSLLMSSNCSYPSVRSSTFMMQFIAQEKPCLEARRLLALLQVNDSQWYMYTPFAFQRLSDMCCWKNSVRHYCINMSGCSFFPSSNYPRRSVFPWNYLLKSLQSIHSQTRQDELKENFYASIAWCLIP